jgi:hypothetical protein
MAGSEQPALTTIHMECYNSGCLNTVCFSISEQKGRHEMTTEEIAELFLAHLYELAEAAPHPHFLFSVHDFAPKLEITDREELQKAIDYLGDRGLIILANLDMFGGISAGITMEGITFVEEGGETGIIQRYRKPPQPPGQPAPGGLSPTQRSLEAILDDMKCALEADAGMPDETRKDLLSDVATLKLQLQRTVRNKPVVDAIFMNLSNVPSLVPFVNALKCIVTP